jgi:hypothetical protein
MFEQTDFHLIIYTSSSCSFTVANSIEILKFGEIIALSLAYPFTFATGL